MAYLFGEPEAGRYKYVPDTDVLSTCKEHFKNICAIVDCAYTTFGLQIDPDQRYTPEGLEKLGISIDQIEQELGFPSGWTDIEIDIENKDLVRLELLRCNIPGSSVKPLLAKYLGRDLTYPTCPYRAPEHK